MRRLLSVPIFGAAVFLGILISPGQQAAADKIADPVLVTNVPLPVTVGNFPATQTVAGSVSASQSGAWTVNVANPRPFFGRETAIVPDGAFGVAEGGTFSAPANSVIETVSVRVLLPAGQKPEASLLILDDIGRSGAVWVPLHLQGNNPAGDVYVGTVTNVHSPVGSTASARQVSFEIGRDASSGVATAVMTVIGIPGV